MSHFDDETRVSPLEALPDGAGSAARFVGHVHPAWNIGANPNGGYLLALAARAMQQRTPLQSDPLSINVHYLRPGLSGMPCHIDTQLLRSGRTLGTVRATLVQDGSARLELLATMGDLGEPGAAGPPVLTMPMPDMPPPEACVTPLGPGARGGPADPRAAGCAAAPRRVGAGRRGPRPRQRLDPLHRRAPGRRPGLPADGRRVSAGGVRPAGHGRLGAHHRADRAPAPAPGARLAAGAVLVATT